MKKLKWAKPEKRAPRPRKRIDRGAAPKRKTPVRKRSKNRADVIAADARWALQVYERTFGLCELRAMQVSCSGDRLEAHHIYGKKAHPALRHVLDNGVAVCRAHHRYVHSAGGRGYLRLWMSVKHPIRWERLQELAETA